MCRSTCMSQAAILVSHTLPLEYAAKYCGCRGHLRRPVQAPTHKDLQARSHSLQIHANYSIIQKLDAQGVPEVCNHTLFGFSHLVATFPKMGE